MVQAPRREGFLSVMPELLFDEHCMASFKAEKQTKSNYSNSQERNTKAFLLFCLSSSMSLHHGIFLKKTKSEEIPHISKRLTMSRFAAKLDWLDHYHNKVVGVVFKKRN